LQEKSKDISQSHTLKLKSFGGKSTGQTDDFRIARQSELLYPALQPTLAANHIQLADTE
jgi:hypothetical protein